MMGVHVTVRSYFKCKNQHEHVTFNHMTVVLTLPTESIILYLST